jgi:hypothetical protein
MKPKEFTEKVNTHLSVGRLFPPLIGKIGNLQIAATLVRNEKFDIRGKVLLANDNTRDKTCLKITSEIGAFTLGQYSSENGMPWATEIRIINHRLEDLVGLDILRRLVDRKSVDRSSRGQKVVGLTISDPGVAPTETPAINDIGFDSFRRH